MTEEEIYEELKENIITGDNIVFPICFTLPLV